MVSCPDFNLLFYDQLCTKNKQLQQTGFVRVSKHGEYTYTEGYS